MNKLLARLIYILIIPSFGVLGMIELFIRIIIGSIRWLFNGKDMNDIIFSAIIPNWICDYMENYL